MAQNETKQWGDDIDLDDDVVRAVLGRFARADAAERAAKAEEEALKAAHDRAYDRRVMLTREVMNLGRAVVQVSGVPQDCYYGDSIDTERAVRHAQGAVKRLNGAGGGMPR